MATAHRCFFFHLHEEISLNSNKYRDSSVPTVVCIENESEQQHDDHGS